MLHFTWDAGWVYLTMVGSLVVEMAAMLVPWKDDWMDDWKILVEETKHRETIGKHVSQGILSIETRQRDRLVVSHLDGSCVGMSVEGAAVGMKVGGAATGLAVGRLG